MVWVTLAVYQFPMRRVAIRRVGLWSLGDGKHLEILFGMTWETDSRSLVQGGGGLHKVVPLSAVCLLATLGLVQALADSLEAGCPDWEWWSVTSPS